MHLMTQIMVIAQNFSDRAFSPYYVVVFAFDNDRFLREDLSNPNVALKIQIGSKVMKIWLPDSLYRIKPLLLILAGAILIILTDSVIPNLKLMDSSSLN